MNWKGLSVLPRNFPGRTEETQEKRQSGFGETTSRIQVRSVTATQDCSADGRVKCNIGIRNSFDSHEGYKTAVGKVTALWEIKG
jgi:hypothetical protein